MNKIDFNAAARIAQEKAAGQAQKFMTDKAYANAAYRLKVVDYIGMYSETSEIVEGLLEQYDADPDKNDTLENLAEYILFKATDHVDADENLLAEKFIERALN